MPRILLVEDHPDTQEWMKNIVESAFSGALIDVAPTVQSAKEWLTRQSYDRVIVDPNLPDGHGFQVISLVRERQPAAEVVVATVFDDDESLVGALKVGAKGYILKDQSDASLIKTLQGMENGEPPLSPSVARQILDYFVNNLQLPPKTPPQQKEVGLLTDREKEILSIIARGASNSDAANSLKISINTVATHIKSIYRKLDISSRAEASLTAARMGLLSDTDVPSSE